MLKKAFALVLVAMAAYRMYFTLLNWGVFEDDHYNHLPGKCSAVEGYVQGSEDMVQLPDGTVLATHGLSLLGNDLYSTSTVPQVTDPISAFDMSNPSGGARKVKVIKKEGSEFDLENMHPHGISHFNDGKHDYIFLVNHGRAGVETVEKFVYDSPAKTLQHIKTYRHELFYSLNDVAATGPDSFYATNMFYFRNALVRMYLEFFLAIPLSNTIYYDSGAVKVVANSVMMNGVNLSPDRKTVYVAQSSPSTGFAIFKRQPNNDLKLIKHQHITGNVDNIDVLPNGDLVLGTQSSLIRALRKLEDAKRNVCPSQVVYVKMQNGQTPSAFTSLLMDDGHLVNGASIATVRGNQLLIGTFHDGMVQCRIDAPY